MLLGYGNYAVTYGISDTGTGSTHASFLTPSAALSDGRSGQSCAIQWPNGTQVLTTRVDLTATIVSPLDAVAPIGVVGLVNVQGLQLGTKVTFNGVTQRLVAGPRGEPCAWWLPGNVGNTQVLSIWNDVNGTPTLGSGFVFAVGEVFFGRMLVLDAVAGTQSRTPTDPTAYSRTDGNQLYQLMRKPFWTLGETNGPFFTNDVKGGALSTIVSGSNPAGKIDLQTLIMNLATSGVVAVCDAPSAGLGSGILLANGARFDQSYMQANWLLARPTSLAQPMQNQFPMWTWAPTWGEAL